MKSRTLSKVSFYIRALLRPFACAYENSYVPDDFPGHHENIQQSQQQTNLTTEFYIPEDPNVPHQTRLDKSNLLLIGPTGVGKTYILEFVLPMIPSVCVPCY